MKILLFTLMFFPSICFSQIDTIHIRDQFYLELNGGTGSLKYRDYYYTPSGKYYDEAQDRSIGASASFQYRNHRWHVGLSTGLLLVRAAEEGSQYFSFDTGLNILPKSLYNNYFGPSFSYGFKQYAGEIFGKTFLEIGLESYFKKFHIGVKYQWFAHANEKYFKTINTTNLYFELGYAFNLSFHKKK